jgi:hypothetical protein
MSHGHMDTTSPVAIDAIRQLRINLYEHLDEVEGHATKTTRWTEEDVETARRLIPDLVTVIRGIISLHEQGPSASCRTCGATWPCQAFEMVHRLVKDPDGEIVRLLTRARESTAGR